jgi:hypothetical protein
MSDDNHARTVPDRVVERDVVLPSYDQPSGVAVSDNLQTSEMRGLPTSGPPPRRANRRGPLKG